MGPCGGLHRGDWIVGDVGVWWVEWWGQNCVGVEGDVGCRGGKVRRRCDGRWGGFW